MARKKVRVRSTNAKFAKVGAEKEVTSDEATALAAMNMVEQADNQIPLPLTESSVRPEPLPRGKSERRDMRAKDK